MVLARVLLLVHGLMTLGYGVAVASNTPGLAEYMSLNLIHDDGRAELVTMYVGMSGAIALWMTYAAMTGRWVREALWFLLVCISGIAIARTASFFLFETGSYTLGALVYDIPMLLLAGFAWHRLKTNADLAQIT